MARRKHSRDRPRAAKNTEPEPKSRSSGSYWLYGVHAVEAALRNPARTVFRLLATAPVAARLRLPSKLAGPEIMARARIAEQLPAAAVHQGIALLTAPLPEVGLDEVMDPGPHGQRRVVLLDQVNDPQNVGAVLRSAAAFEAQAVILTRRHAPPESAALAKAASGALESVPLVRVANLARTLEALAARGFWRIGLDAGAKAALSEVDLSGDLALVLGAEGAGLRRLTAERCDQLARLEMADTMASLNVSAAAAIALFLAYQARL
jgi:23S rRNA (guanosine2251-2'-O)-methyltransferase